LNIQISTCGQETQHNPMAGLLFIVLGALGLYRMLMECADTAERWLFNAESAVISIVSTALFGGVTHTNILLTKNIFTLTDDRLDAFLCSECGYCASGSFSYELVAGTATNAVAITNDIEYARSQNMLAVCTRMHGDIASMLIERYKSLVKPSNGPQKNANQDLPVYDGQVLPIPWQKRQSMSITLDSLGKPGAVVQAVARPHTVDHCARGSTDRRTTWLAIARTTGSSSTERRNAEDTVIQHIREDVEDESDLLGLLETSRRVGDHDSADSIGRLLERVRNRHSTDNDRANEAVEPAGGALTAIGESRPISVKEGLEVCTRLHLFLRESERECFELRRRIQSWERLNRDDLAGLDSIKTDFEFVPCRCPNCSSTVASCLLSLWQNLFMADTDNGTISAKMVAILLYNEGGSSLRSLNDSKRAAVEIVSTRSKRGAELVLDGLRKRMAAGPDTYASSVLGAILQSPVASPLRSSFVELATQQLEQWQF
jgi:hypothetical protein